MAQVRCVQLVRFLLLSSSGIEGKEHYIKDAYWCEKTTLFPATTITLLRWVCGRVTLSRFRRATWTGRRVQRLAFTDIVFLGRTISWPVAWRKPLSENVFEYATGSHRLTTFAVLSFDGSIKLWRIPTAQWKFPSITCQFPVTLAKQNAKVVN